MALAQDKRRQRAALQDGGFPVPPHRANDGVDDVLRFGTEYGWPVVAKASQGGYDGRGVWLLDGPPAAADLVARTSEAGITLLAEQRVAIDRELAVIVARRPSGEALAYPAVETVQRDGICRELLVPAPVAPDIAAAAQRLALAVAEAVDTIGVMALELFLAGGELLVNEIASRPHNSGHYSIEACITSQFEQHLRAVLDWPLGAPDLVAPAAATVNVLGPTDGTDPAARLSAALSVPGVHIHLYGKAARPGRKLGHVTALGETGGAARSRAVRAVALLTGADAVEDLR